MADQIEYGTTGKPHPYHIVRPSLWPLFASLAAGLFVVGMVLLMHDISFGKFHIGWKGTALGIIAILIAMYGWWKDVVHETITEKAHNSITEIGMRYGMVLFIASEVMFFVAFFWAFFDVSLFANELQQFLRVEYTQGQWPPPQIEVIDPFYIPLLMTIILLLSGCTVTWAHYEILEGRQRQATQALAITVFLGFFFLGFQIYEYTHATFPFDEGAFSSTFYMATGFHGFHVFVGSVFLAVCLLRQMKGHFTPKKHFGFEAAAWYWHFVDVVWLFLFIAIYFWGSIIGINQGG